MKLVILILCVFQCAFCEINRSWWKNTILYEVYLPTFKDGNGDGVGDLKGLISKLDYFVEMGIECVYITPHYMSPMDDAGYDITNFTAVNPLMGTMEDFEELMAEAKARGLKVIIDIVINHTSDKHPWFEKSINKEKPYTDYYVWKDAKKFVDDKPIPPTNWVSVFKGSAWKWNEKRQQFYLHLFTAQQPDLNLRNKLVKNEIKKIFKFWLDKGVAGFRLDAAKYLFEDELFRDDPVVSPDILVPYKPTDVVRLYTANLPETFQFYHSMRKYTDRATQKFGDYERIFVPEVYGNRNVLVKYYDTANYKITQLPLNFALASINAYQNATYFHNLINDYLNILPAGATLSWNSNNHDKLRKANMFTKEYAFIYTTMVMMLPGVAYVYYGQEIGMVGSRIREEQQVDKHQDDLTHKTRDIARQPMQWDDSINAGFSSNPSLYLPVNPDYWDVNVKTQKLQSNSNYNLFKKMVNLRQTETLKHGEFKSYVLSTWVFAFTRTLKIHTTYLVVANLGSETEFVDLSNSIPDLPYYMQVEIASANSGYKQGQAIPTVSSIPQILILRPSAAIVLSSEQS